MASFREMCFTPAEFAQLAKLDKSIIGDLEQQGLLKTIKKKIGNVDRKMITLEDMQDYFRTVRDTAPASMGDGAEAAGAPIPVEALSSVAAATDVLFKRPKTKIQMFYNVKGGTGKSTLTAQYVMRASMMGLKVLAIDLDGQGHLTVNLDILDAHERPTIYDVLINDLPIDQSVINVAPGLDLIPANLGLCNIEIPLNNKPRREYRLSEAIAKIADQYDLIVADTNPAASILNGSMLVASGLVNVVCATNPLSFHGMSLVMTTIEELEREFRHKLQVRIVPNMYDNREVISQEVLGELRTQFPESCTRTVINRSADLNEATKRRTTVWDVSSKGTAAQDINSLAEELIFT
ncbi:MAG: ParA family protein [Bdellovibrionales bacterium]|nr:ParA family protein [Bdellovibrionales bacterium]